MSSVLSVTKLTKTYGALQAVKGISFEVAPGEIFALIGPNGAGKSTTLRMLATILTPSGGTARIGGFDLQTQAAEVRRIISYLPEEAGAYKNLTGAQYLQFMASLYADSKTEHRREVELAAEITQLKDRLKDKVGTYSKGMTRKLLLARTVMSQPQLAILDEPTSGLDVINAFEIRGIVKKMAAQGMAVLLSSHNMLEIEFLSDRVAIINQGTILESGTAAELKKKHAVSNLEEVFVKAVA